MSNANRSPRTALLVLDDQNYFFDESYSAYLKMSPLVLPKINDLVAHSVQRDWDLVATTHHAPSEPDNLMAEKWRHLPRGSESLIFPGLALPEQARHISKEYYSAFFKTNLEEILRERNVDSVVVCGVMTHLCVDTTVRHAFMLGLKPVVVGDACCSKSDAYHSASLAALAHGFAQICTTDQIRDRQL
jgi:bifunctional isochorismate lyase/aryl carrier protein